MFDVDQRKGTIFSCLYLLRKHYNFSSGDLTLLSCSLQSHFDLLVYLPITVSELTERSHFDAHFEARRWIKHFTVQTQRIVRGSSFQLVPNVHCKEAQLL